MENKTDDWEHFEHMADIGIRGYGDTPESAFENIAMALSATVCDLADIRPATGVTLHCESPDRELLLLDWLNTLVYEMATRRMLFSEFHIEMNDSTLTAIVRGEKINRERHQPAVEIKGATCTELAVRKTTEGRWLAQCVIDV